MIPQYEESPEKTIVDPCEFIISRRNELSDSQLVNEYR